MARINDLSEENQKLREANRRLQLEGPALERDKLVEQLRAEIQRLSQCGLCGKSETTENAIFICCQDCSHLGYSEVPKEVFELQRQRDAALATVATLTEERDRLKACAEHYAADAMWKGNVYQGWQDARYLAREALKDSK